MGFDRYCALCCGPLGIYFIHCGSSEDKALRRRRKRVEQKRRRLAGEDVVHEDSQEYKTEERLEFPKAEEGPMVDGSVTNALSRESSFEEGEEMQDVEEDDKEMEDAGDDDEDGDDDGMSQDSDEELASGYDVSDNEVAELEAEEQEWQERSSSHHDDSDICDDDDDASDHWSQASELSIPSELDLARQCRDETDSLYNYHEEHTYDPEKISREDLQWIDRCRVLGINPELDDERKAFISGRGRFDGHFDFEIGSAGSDPRDPKIDNHPLYHCCEPETDTATFPFHEECFKLLVKCLGYENRKEVDKDVLYAVMLQNVEKFAAHLTLHYEKLEGDDQYWECYAGHEWCVANPGAKDGIHEEIKSMLPAQLFSRSDTHLASVDLGHKVKNDPLTVLPYDVLHGIFSDLSIKDTKSLINASLYVFGCTREPTFWRRMIRIHIVSFFWELDSMLQDTTFPNTFDWKGFFQWLNTTLGPTFGMEGPLMAIVNRRRIWKVCQQIAPLYHEKFNAEGYEEPTEAEAATIMEQAKTYDTRITMFPQPQAHETQIITTQFIHSWSEPEYRACDIDTYWSNQYGTLTGISVKFGSAQRVFGSTEGTKGLSMHIKAGEWIKEIQISVRKLDLWDLDKYKDLIEGRDDPRAIHDSHIDGMKVSLHFDR